MAEDEPRSEAEQQFADLDALIKRVEELCVSTGHWTEDLTLDEHNLIADSGAWIKAAGSIRDELEAGGEVDPGRFDAFQAKTEEFITLGRRVDRSGRLVTGFDPTPYQTFYVEAFAPRWPDEFNPNRLQAWLNLAILEAGRVIEDLRGVAAVREMAIEPTRPPSRGKPGPPTVNAERDEQIREWRYRDKLSVKEVVRRVRERYGQAITPGRVSQTAKASDRDSWMLANPRRD